MAAVEDEHKDSPSVSIRFLAHTTSSVSVGAKMIVELCKVLCANNFSMSVPLVFQMSAVV